MRERDLRRTYGAIIDAVVAADLDALDHLIADDVVDHNAVPGQGVGRDGIKYWVGVMHEAFAGLTCVIEDTVVERDKIAARVTWRGTHKGDLVGVPGTGPGGAAPTVQPTGSYVNGACRNFAAAAAGSRWTLTYRSSQVCRSPVAASTKRGMSVHVAATRQYDHPGGDLLPCVVKPQPRLDPAVRARRCSHGRRSRRRWLGQPEVDGVFLCRDEAEVDFFCTMNAHDGPVDVWAVEGVEEADLIESPEGFAYVPDLISPQALTLSQAGREAAPFPQAEGSTAYRSALTITFSDGRVLRGAEAHDLFRGEARLNER